MAAPMVATLKEPETFIFNARFCGKRKLKIDKPSVEPVEIKINKTPVPTGKIFNIKRARYEVIRYGMTGFDKERQMNNKIAMAIRLGAKPPKKKSINYKTLMEQKLKEKEAVTNEKRSRYNLQPLKQRKKSGKKKKLKNHPNSLV